MDEDAGDIANMDVIALEMGLEENNSAVVHGTINEVVHEQINAHAWRHTEYCRKTERDAVPAIKHGFLCFDFRPAVKTDRAQGCFLGAELAGLTHSISAIGDRQKDPL